MYPTKHKNDMYGIFSRWKKLVEVHMGRTIKFIWLDNSGEYTRVEFKNFFSQEGIKTLHGLINSTIKWSSGEDEWNLS